MEDEFAIWWKNYPRKTAKQVARKAYAARRNEGVAAADLLTAAKSYAYEREGEPPKFTMHAATFLGPNERWRDSMPASGHADDDEDDPGPSYFDTLAGRR